MDTEDMTISKETLINIRIQEEMSGIRLREIIGVVTSLLGLALFIVITNPRVFISDFFLLTNDYLIKLMFGSICVVVIGFISVYNADKRRKMILRGDLSFMKKF
jgi:hypothetical protein